VQKLFPILSVNIQLLIIQDPSVTDMRDAQRKETKTVSWLVSTTSKKLYSTMHRGSRRRNALFW